ncbi:NAD(P)/FAD-dependent oxidoreductase [Amycolatopsis sp. FDAARGOS 1241]|uniref:NAD(P)/FAD-dependent oxidoreductase n=1 Tax=Amycolatopsis sp. FDAARGOS 1241 TaxID=2778070 RepID=UPI00194E9429|nr:NAD(P)/FAD-dependent oxidoreductase [Amycolatopsis sp. FDAARGOS 1241]QRP50242.1 NAD(P)/FAD-dependent oxidoreductase [Amycolatopsis sp. FDAARGOS 1241]
MTGQPGASRNVVVLGGGLAGVACAQRLGDEGVGVTLVDRNDYHQFQPLLYQVATAQLPAEDIARPHRVIFRDHPTVEVRTAHVTDLDVADLGVTLADGEKITGSHLVIAAGAQPEYFGVPGAAEHAFPLYSVADAERLRIHVQDVLRAVSEGQLDENALDIVVVGGGPTGVEITGALTELMTALATMERIPASGKIFLIDRGSRLLGAFSDRSHKYAYDRLSEQGAEPRLDTGVASVHADRVELEDGTAIPTRTVIWGGGESAAPVVQAAAGLKTGRGGRVDVLPDLTVAGLPGVYAVGDAANIPARHGATLPQLGSVAQQSGEWSAGNILRERSGQPTKPFHYKDKGIMAMIGRNAAVAEVGKHRHQVDGPLAFAAWLGVHAMLLSGVHSKVDAFMSWAWDYFERDHAAIVEWSARPKRIVWGDEPADAPHISAGRKTSGDSPPAAGDS